MFASVPSAGLPRGRVSLVGLVKQSVDPVLIVLSFALACLVSGTEFGGQELVLCIIAFSLTFPGEVSVRRLKQNLFGSIVVNWLLLFALIAFFGYATKFIGHFSPRVLGIWFVATPMLLYIAHRSIPWLMPQLLAVDGYRSAVVVAANGIGQRLARSLRDEPSFGFRFAGFLVEPGAEPRPLPEHGPVLGTIEQTASVVKAQGIQAVFIALPMAAQPQVLALLQDLRDTTASIYFVPDIFIADLIQARIDDINGLPVVAVCETPFVGPNAVLKRAMDLVVAASLATLLAPLMLMVAVGVKRSSPGPVLFRQRRYGLDGQEIMVLKFRTMRVQEDGASVRQASRHDQRVTRFGAFLRRTSIDELPQLFNVLKGTMSLVGPRPHAVAHNEMYRHLIQGYMVRHKVKPGITGWAQVNGLRGETDTVEKMRARIEFDLEYLRRWSVGFDLLILVKTAFIVLRRTNAY